MESPNLLWLQDQENMYLFNLATAQLFLLLLRQFITLGGIMFDSLFIAWLFNTTDYIVNMLLNVTFRKIESRAPLHHVQLIATACKYWIKINVNNIANKIPFVRFFAIQLFQ